MKALESYKLDDELSKALIKQLNKDLSGIEDKALFSLDEKYSWQNLIEVLEPVVDRLVNLDSNRFFRLLYTIDVDEKKVKQILFGKSSERTSWLLTQLILERELLKTMTKIRFAEKKE